MTENRDPGLDAFEAPTLGADSFEGIFELAESSGEWREDMRVTYRRRA